MYFYGRFFFLCKQYPERSPTPDPAGDFTATAEVRTHRPSPSQHDRLPSRRPPRRPPPPLGCPRRRRRHYQSRHAPLPPSPPLPAAKVPATGAIERDAVPAAEGGRRSGRRRRYGHPVFVPRVRWRQSVALRPRREQGRFESYAKESGLWEMGAKGRGLVHRGALHVHAARRQWSEEPRVAGKMFWHRDGEANADAPLLVPEPSCTRPAAGAAVEGVHNNSILGVGGRE